MLYIASSLHFKLHLFEISDVMKSVMSVDEHILSHLDLIFVVIQSVISFGVLVEAHFSLMYSLTLFCIMSLKFFVMFVILIVVSFSILSHSLVNLA